MPEQAIAQIKKLLVTDQLPELGPEKRADAQSVAALNAKLDLLFGESTLPTGRQQLIRALLLLWHDHLDASHDISQGIHSVEGSFLHAIMHRREPDYWNSKYWFRRVGDHPCFRQIALRVGVLLKGRRAGELAAKLLPDGRWDAFAFVDVCEAAERGAATEQRELLREIQRIESEVLLESFLSEPSIA